MIIRDKKIIVQLCDSDRIRNKKFNSAIFLKNLAYKATEEDIRNFFKNKTINRVLIPRNEQGRSKGFAYVELQKFKEYQECIDMKQGKIQGRLFSIYKSDR